ncbi:MAG TPA: MarR family transcriptional regulator [Marmoricola sp.]|nr:MarR family transcriptional regulator [Marmoricola sp.]
MDSPEVDPIAQAHRQWQARGWSDQADAMAMVTSLVRAQQLLHERIEEVLKPYGLTFARFELLRLLGFARSGSMPMARMGTLLQVHPTSITSAVDRLVAQGYVERLRREEDRRVVLAAITDLGWEVVEDATETLNHEVFATPGLNASDQRSMIRLLGKLRSHHGDVVQRLR